MSLRGVVHSFTVYASSVWFVRFHFAVIVGQDEDMGGGMGESGVSGEEVSGFLDSLYCLCKWTPECNIMALILIIRLFQVCPYTLT